MRGTVEKYNASWRIRYEVGVKANGRRDQRSKAGFKTRRDAEAALAEALERVRRGDVFDARRVTVGEFLDSWLSSKRNIRPTTERAYAGHIRVYLKPLIGAVALSALRAEHLDRMYEAIRAGELRRAPGPATIRRIHATRLNSRSGPSQRSRPGPPGAGDARNGRWWC
jgi:Arm DNA-binding domain